MFGTTFRDGNANFLSSAPGGSQRANALTAVVVAVRAFNGNGQADSLLFAERESWVECQALATIVPSSAAFGNLDTGPAVGAPCFTSRANASTAVVVIARAFLGNEDAVVQNGTEAVFRLVG